MLPVSALTIVRDFYSVVGVLFILAGALVVIFG